LLLRKLPAKQNQPWYYLLLKLLSAFTILFTGLLFDMNKLKDVNNQWALPVFVLVLIIAIGSTTADVILGRSK